MERLEKAVARLEALSSSSSRGFAFSDAGAGEDPSSDPAIKALDDLIADNVARVSAAAEKIGGKVLDATKVLQEAFSVLRELLVKVKQTQVLFLLLRLSLILRFSTDLIANGFGIDFD